MRLLTISKLLALGAAAAWVYKRRQGASADVIDSDDPVQRIADDQFDDSDLSFDAVDAADAEAARDLAMLESELDERALEIDAPSETMIDASEVSVEGDVGELYGVHTPRAVDNSLLDDRAAMDEGQNWIEALQESAVEFGADPEHEIDVLDDQDTRPHTSDMRDLPVADRGSGGPAGV